LSKRGSPLWQNGKPVPNLIDPLFTAWMESLDWRRVAALESSMGWEYRRALKKHEEEVEKFRTANAAAKDINEWLGRRSYREGGPRG